VPAHDGALVSVIVPVYDREYCVTDAVMSVLDQTHRRLECIVVDDGSADGSLGVVKAMSARDGRVRVFAQCHRGVSAARNRGIEEARGEYVTFLDSDDLMPPDRLRRQLELLAASRCDAVFGGHESVVMPGVVPPPWWASRPDWTRGDYWNTLLVPTALLRAVGGFDVSLEIGEDVDLFLTLRETGLQITAVDEIFVLRRIFGDNLTYDLVDRRRVLLDLIRRRNARRRGLRKDVVGERRQ